MKLGGGPKDFYYLSHYTKCTTINHKDDAADHREMMESFGVLGFGKDEQRSVLRVCAAVPVFYDTEKYFADFSVWKFWII